MGYRIPDESPKESTIDWLSIPLSDLGAQAGEWIVRTLMQQLSKPNTWESGEAVEIVRSVSQFLKHLPRRAAGWDEGSERIVLDVLQECAPEVRKEVVKRLKEYQEARAATEDGEDT